MKKFVNLVKAIHSVNMEILKMDVSKIAFSTIISAGIPLAIIAWIWFCDSLTPKIGVVWTIVLALIWVEIPMLMVTLFYILYLISKYCFMIQDKLGEEE